MAGFINPVGRPSGPSGGPGRILTEPVTAPAGGTVGPTGARGAKGDKGDTGDTGPHGIAGSTGGALSVVAITNIPAFQAITHSGDRANSGNTAHFGKVIGVTKAVVSSGFSVDVTQIGELVNSGWTWTPGDIVYLNGNLLSSVSPVSGFVQKLGIARNSTTLIVELASPVLL